MNDTQSLLQIVAVPAWQRSEALRLTFRRLAEAELPQYLEMALTAEAAATSPWDGLLGAYRGGQMVGAVYSQIQPGRTAALWPPQLIAPEPSDTATALLDAANRRLAARNVQIVQTLLSTGAQPDAAVLCEGGFSHLSDLLYLVCLKDGFPAESPPGPLQFGPYSADAHARFVRVVEATYVDTLDCPGLNGLRDIEDVLTGYRAAGVFDCDRWLFVRHDGVDVGCLILTDHPGYDTWELIYMGVVPQARGHSWGKDIARRAQWLSRVAGKSRLVVAVDAANTPAIRMYSAVGFETWDRRSVYLKVFGC